MNDAEASARSRDRGRLDRRLVPRRGTRDAYGYDPATFTHERATRAVRAGVAAVLNGITGIVIRLDWVTGARGAGW